MYCFWIIGGECRFHRNKLEDWGGEGGNRTVTKIELEEISKWQKSECYSIWILFIFSTVNISSYCDYHYHKTHKHTVGLSVVRKFISGIECDLITKADHRDLWLIRENLCRVPVAHAYNQSYLRGSDQEDYGLKQVWANSVWNPTLKKTHHKKGLVEWFKV
jgi:hypothetical protein